MGFFFTQYVGTTIEISRIYFVFHPAVTDRAPGIIVGPRQRQGFNEIQRQLHIFNVILQIFTLKEMLEQLVQLLPLPEKCQMFCQRSTTVTDI